MFHLAPTYTNPVRRTKTSQRFQLGTNRSLPPPLEADEKSYLVELSGEDDPANAKNWRFSHKMIAALILGFDTLVASWGSSVYSAAVTPVALEFGVGSVISLLGLTLYICGFATGPLAFGPLSEFYGRKIPITVAAFIFTCFMFACATAKDFQTLMLCRFFAGVFASCPLVVVGGAFSDIFGNETRGIAIACFSALVFIGPFISPIAAAFITESHLGWRWTQYITSIMGGFATVLDVLFLEETYQKTILRKRAQFIRSETQNWAIHHVSEEENIDFKELVNKHLALPLKLLFLEPIVFLITLYTSFIYGILYLFLEAYPIVFAEYRGISPSISTLMYIGLIIGVLLGCAIVIAFEPRYNRKLKENNGIPVPEQRLLPMMVGAILFPIGLFWFAWTGNYSSISWAALAVSGILSGAGILNIFLQALNYLVDAYLMVSASSIAADTFLRSLFGAGFPLFATQMFHKLGVDWAGSLLGFLAVAFMPIPFLFYIFGARLRKMSSCAPTDFGAPKKADEEAQDSDKTQ
ncbi:MFS general substrate transporter [Karstenula rhodostoma CBS 690.94]|uniref:MFS general substrate transporter n=1 Tax=Karstenula rhodostoma CBS 690.94 TaxID=1392251 RepID=A0A9P4UA35_9PLEO|nr:MFS general substrate transporter [Karstenula rhodostoma CBS 690.94]